MTHEALFQHGFRVQLSRLVVAKDHTGYTRVGTGLVDQVQHVLLLFQVSLARSRRRRWLGCRYWRRCHELHGDRWRGCGMERQQAARTGRRRRGRHGRGWGGHIDRRRYNAWRVRREWWRIDLPSLPPYRPPDGVDRVCPNVPGHCAQSDHGHHHGDRKRPGRPFRPLEAASLGSPPPLPLRPGLGLGLPPSLSCLPMGLGRLSPGLGRLLLPFRLWWPETPV